MNNNLKAFLNVTSGFLPLIILWGIPNHLGLVLGLVSALMLLLKEIINKNIGILSSVLLIYFTIFNIFYFGFKMESAIQYKYLTSYIVLALTGFISIILARPYTLYEARSGYSKEFGKSPLFIEVNIVITKIWAIIYLINALIELIDHNTVTVMIMNILIIIGMILSIMIPRAFPEV